MEKSILEAIERFSLLKNADTVTVALSGGADSMALLYALFSLKEKLGITVKAAHLNHLIRGDEALRDEEFVKAACKKLGVELTVKREDVPAYATELGISTELAARVLRYKFLEGVADGGLIATAHTASDNLETVILNLTRGSGIDGLSGIPPKRGAFIRPVILCTRAQIEEYCEINKIPFVTDSTNHSDDYTRNKIRHNIVPVLKELNPSVEATVLRSALLLREDSAFLENAADKFLNKNTSPDGKLSLNGFDVLETSVAKRAIKSYIEKANPDISPENIHIEEALRIAVKGGRTSLPKNYSLISANGYLYLRDNSNSQEAEFSVNLTECENLFLSSTKKINNLLLNNLINCDKIVGKLVVRTRQSGDSIRILGRGCTKTLNKLYNECKIPAELRKHLPVIADDNGVVWVYGIGVAQRCAVNNKTKRVIKVDVKRED